MSRSRKKLSPFGRMLKAGKGSFETHLIPVTSMIMASRTRPQAEWSEVCWTFNFALAAMCRSEPG
jgi:hypothetical protein